MITDDEEKATKSCENHLSKIAVRIGKKRKRSHQGASSKNNISSSTAVASIPPMPILNSLINPNFVDLSSSYPEFKRELGKLRERQKNKPGKKSSLATNVDFNFNVALSRAILDKHFNLNLKCMPKGYLCPPIPNRLNYVLWLKELIRQTSSKDMSNTYFKESPKGPIFRGLDLGIGVSCIYPLLLSHNNFTERQPWQFLGTDIDPFSIKCAQENIDANDLNDVVKLALVPAAPADGGCRKIDRTDDNYDITTPIKTAIKAARSVYDETDVRFDFCMSNPPFYSDMDEATAPRSGDGRDRTDMTLNESVYPGGEVGFSLDMIYDSFSFQGQIMWYTVMLSKKSSLITIERELTKLGFCRGAVRTAEFMQGKMTRWGIAWTFLTPSVRSPVTKLVGGVVSFEVKLEDDIGRDKAIREVCDRFKLFSSDFRVVQLNCIQDSDNHLMISGIGNVGDAKSDQFRIDIYVDCKDIMSLSTVNVRLDSFSSNIEGVRTIRNIHTKIEGEICRTNRRWRRIEKVNRPEL